MVREGCRTFCNSSNLGLFREVGGRNFLFSPGNRGEHDPWMGACRSALEPASRPRGEIGATASHARTHIQTHVHKGTQTHKHTCTQVHSHTHIDTHSHTCTHAITHTHTHTHTHALTTKHPQRPGFPRHASSSAPTSLVHAVPASPEHSSPSLLS